MISLLSFLILSSAARAAPPLPPALPAAGRYAFSGEIIVEDKIRYEAVPASSQRLADLRGAEYDCVAKSRVLFLCRKILPAASEAELLRPYLTQRLAAAELGFGKPEGDPKLTVEGEVYFEYSVPQTASLRGHLWPSYRAVFVDGNWMIRIGDNAQEEFSAQLNLLGDGRWALIQKVAVPESKTAYSVYWPLAVFRRM